VAIVAQMQSSALKPANCLIVSRVVCLPGFNSADYLHVHVEAKKLAFADRAR
jgi:gamma-glutamyltranspeptidase